MDMSDSLLRRRIKAEFTYLKNNLNTYHRITYSSEYYDVIFLLFWKGYMMNKEMCTFVYSFKDHFWSTHYNPGHRKADEKGISCLDRAHSTVGEDRLHWENHSLNRKLNLNRWVRVSWVGKEKGREAWSKKGSSICEGTRRACYIQGRTNCSELPEYRCERLES